MALRPATEDDARRQAAAEAKDRDTRRGEVLKNTAAALLIVTLAEAAVLAGLGIVTLTRGLTRGIG